MPGADYNGGARKSDGMAPSPQGSANKKRPSDQGGNTGGPLKRTQNAQGPLLALKLVCPDSKAGAVIGKGGGYIKTIREQTGSDVMVEKSLPGVVDRIVQLSSSPATVPGKNMSAVQAALLMVIDKIVEDDTPKGKAPPQHVEFRLLADRGLAAAVLSASSAPQGTVLLDVRKYCGAAVIVAPPTGRPVQAAASDELIKVAGSLEAVREAFRVVTDRMRETLSGMRPSPLPGKPHPAASAPHSFPPDLLPPAAQQKGAGGQGRPAGAAAVRPPPPGGAKPSGPPVDTEYRLVVQDRQIGCILGKGGQLAKTIREQTGSDMRIERVLQGAQDRLIVCHSAEPPESDFCAAADALMVCLDKLVQDYDLQVSRGTPIGPFRTVLLLRPIQTSVITARGGSTLIQIQGETRAQVTLLPPNAAPRCTEPGDSALMVEGKHENVLAAVRAVSIVLRACQVRAHLGLPQVDNTGAVIPLPPLAGAPAQPPPPQRPPPGALPPPSLMPPPGALPGMHQPPPPKGPPSRPLAPEDQIQAAVQRFLTTMAAQQAGQTPATGGARPPPAVPPPYGAPPPAAAALPPAYGGMPPPAAYAPPPGVRPPAGEPATAPIGTVRVTMTVLPAQASALVARGGAAISQIRAASGAKIKLHDQPTITGDRELEITGSAEQATAARNMINSAIGVAAAPPPTQPPPPAGQPPLAPLAYGSAPPAYSQPPAPVAAAPFQYAQPQPALQPPQAGAYSNPAQPAGVPSGYYQAPQPVAAPIAAPTAQSYPVQSAQQSPQQPPAQQPQQQQQYDPLYAQQYAQYYAQQQAAKSAAAQQPPAAAATATQYGAPAVTAQQYGQPAAATAAAVAPTAQQSAPAGQQYATAAASQPGGTASSQQAQYEAYQLQVQQYNAAVLAQQQAQQALQQQTQPQQQQQQPEAQGQAQQYGVPPTSQQYSSAGAGGGPAYGAQQQQQQYSAATPQQQPAVVAQYGPPAGSTSAQQPAWGQQQQPQQPQQQQAAPPAAGGYARQSGGGSNYR